MSSNAPHIRIGTRGSDLALWQAHHVRDLLQARGATVEIVVLKTRGDQIQNVSFDKMEGKGFFTKEIEQALLDGDVDLAVHSHKDLETTPLRDSWSPRCPRAGLSKTWSWCAPNPWTSPPPFTFSVAVWWAPRP